MRIIRSALFIVACLLPAAASAQSFHVQGAVGPNFWDTAHNLSYGVDPGLSLSGGIGFSPSPRVTLLLDVERTRRASQLQLDTRGSEFGFHGGTVTFAVPQLRVALFGPDRVTPYLVLGFAAGTSELNATASHPDGVRHDARAAVVGGGVHGPLGDHVSLFADWRIFFGGENNEIFGIAPLRAGVGWRF